MIEAPAAVQALLASGKEFKYADLYTIVLLGGSVMRYTTTQRDVWVPNPLGGPNLVYVAGQVLVKGLKIRSKIGVEVDEQDLEIICAEGATFGGVNAMAALRLGVLDGAVITRQRAYFTEWETDPVGGAAITLWTGLVSSLTDIGRKKASVKVKSAPILLDLNMPRNLFQGNCRWTLFDEGCKLVKADFGDAATVNTALGTVSRVAIPTAAASSEYRLGTVEFSTGANAGTSRTVLSIGSNMLYLMYPLHYPPENGDVFTAYIGCDRSLGRCQALNNEANFVAYPFVPTPETAV